MNVSIRHSLQSHKHLNFLSTMPNFRYRDRNPAIHHRARAVKPQLIDTGKKGSNTCCQNSNTAERIMPKFPRLYHLTTLYNSASTKSRDFLTRASYHRERVVNVSVNSHKIRLITHINMNVPICQRIISVQRLTMVHSRTHPRDQDQSILLLDVARRMFE